MEDLTIYSRIELYGVNHKLIKTHYNCGIKLSGDNLIIESSSFNKSLNEPCVKCDIYDLNILSGYKLYNK